MKQVTREKTEKYIAYQAIDGTEFTSEEQCRKYEQTAAGVIRGKLKPFIVKDDMDAWELLGGVDEHTVMAIQIPSERDMDTVLQYIFYEEPWLLNTDDTSRKERIEKIVHEAYTNEDLLLLGKNCDGDVYMLNTRMHYVNNLLGIDKSEKKEEEFRNEG